MKPRDTQILRRLKDHGHREIPGNREAALQQLLRLDSKARRR